MSAPAAGTAPNVLYVDLPTREPAFSPALGGALGRIAERVGAGLSLDEVLEVVWRETAEMLPRDRIGFSFIDEDGARVVARWFKADYEAVALGNGYEAGLAGSSLADLLGGGKARVIRDLAAYLAQRPESDSTARLVREGVRSSLTLPLVVSERPVGFLFFSSRKTDAFTPGHAAILAAVLGRISQAVEKALIIKRLSDSRDSYLSTLGFISHEIKNPLASIIGRGETYARGYLGQADPKAVEVIQRMTDLAKYLADMVDNYMDFTRLETGDMRLETKDAVRFGEDVLKFAASAVQPQAERRGAAIVVDVPPEGIAVRGDPDLLRIVMVNLLDNAVKYGYDGGQVRAAAKVENGRLMVTVRNAGVGFTQEQAGRLFKRFVRLRQKGTEDRRGSGLGLYLCWYIAQLHGGRLSADSEPGQWAQFTLTLPGASAG